MDGGSGGDQRFQSDYSTPGPVLSAAHRLTLPALIPFRSASQSVSRSDVSDPLWPRGLQLARLLCPWGFSRPEYCSGLPFSSPRDLPDPGMEPGLLHCRQILYRPSHQGSPHSLQDRCYFSSHFKIRKVRKRAVKSLSPGLSDAGAWAVRSQLPTQPRVL